MSRITAFSMYRIVAIVAVVGLLTLAACGGAINYPQAHVRVVNGKQVVLLRGRRLLMAHDPISALMRKTYKDSVLLPLPVADGVLQGSSIPVEPGYYTYAGEIQRRGKSLTVNLYFNNTDDNSKDPVGWNGRYELVSR